MNRIRQFWQGLEDRVYRVVCLLDLVYSYCYKTFGIVNEVKRF